MPALTIKSAATYLAHCPNVIILPHSLHIPNNVIPCLTFIAPSLPISLPASLHLYVSISLYLYIPISLYLPISPYISLYLPISLCISLFFSNFHTLFPLKLLAIHIILHNSPQFFKIFQKAHII